jgi:HEPN domain-containing protein
MKPPEEVQRGLVRQWIAKAAQDMDAAVFLLTQGDRFSGAIGFHSQQAAEKYLKALLVRHQIDFAKTHDIEKLLRILQPVEPRRCGNLDRCEVAHPLWSGDPISLTV